jgi:hypothetical protein
MPNVRQWPPVASELSVQTNIRRVQFRARARQKVSWAPEGVMGVPAIAAHR